MHFAFAIEYFPIQKLGSAGQFLRYLLGGQVVFSAAFYAQINNLVFQSPRAF